MPTTEGRLDWPHLFFASFGRLGRAPFAGALAIVFALFASFDLWVVGAARTVTAWAVFLVLFFSACCLLAKRLHDRGRSGWWTALVMMAFLHLWPRPHGPGEWLWIAVVGLAAVDLLLMPGQRQANRFGPPPGEAIS